MPEPLEPSDDFADLVERLRRPTGPSRGSEWQGTESVTIPAALDEALAAFVETHRRRGIRPSRWPLAGKPPALLVDQCTRAQEAFLVDAVARRLVRRLYSFDMRDPDAAASSSRSATRAPASCTFTPSKRHPTLRASPRRSVPRRRRSRSWRR